MRQAWKSEHTLVVIAAVWDVLLGTEPGEPGDPGDPGEPGEPGRLAAGDWLVREVLVPLERESLKLGLCRPERFVFRSTSFSSLSFTKNKNIVNSCHSSSSFFNPPPPAWGATKPQLTAHSSAREKHNFNSLLRRNETFNIQYPPCPFLK